MKPSLIRYFFGHGFRVAMSIGAITLTVAVGLSCGGFSIWSFIAAVVAVPLGGVLGALFLWPIVFRIGSRVNGAPFRNGEVVHILAGKYRDRIGRISDIWTQRNSVIVQFDEDQEKEVIHEFSYNEVCRAGVSP
jgi:hypothetical protein